MSGSTSLQPGTLFHERYRVVRCIKRGGMGAVFEVVDEKTSTRRALKVMRSDLVDDDDLRGRFEREARVTGVVESDHVVRVSDAGVDESSDTPFLVMDFLRGADLGALIGGGKRLGRDEVVRYLGQAALGLERAHAAGIVHRDLKPENLFLTRRDDGSQCVVVLDFGIAKMVARRTQVKDTRTMGTPAYMAPEQIRGEGTIGPRADVYALAHIAYTLLVGEEYWSDEARNAGSTFAFFSRVVEGMPELPSKRARRTAKVELGEAFDGWLMRAAANNPEDRFASEGAAVIALAEALDVAAPLGITKETLVSPRDDGLGRGEPSPRRALRATPPGPAEAPTLTTQVSRAAVADDGLTVLDPLAPVSRVLTDQPPVGPLSSQPGDGALVDTIPVSVWSHPTAPSFSVPATERDATLDEVPKPRSARSRPARRATAAVVGAGLAVAMGWFAVTALQGGAAGVDGTAKAQAGPPSGAPVVARSSTEPVAAAPPAAPMPSAVREVSSAAAPSPSTDARSPKPKPGPSARPLSASSSSSGLPGLL